MDFPAKNDVLWESIATSLYSAVVAYVIIVLIAFVRDFSRNLQSASSSSRPHTAFIQFYYRFSAQYRDTYVIFYFEFIRLLTNLVICVLYVLGTVHRDVPNYTSTIYRVFTSIFIFDLLVQILMSESAMATVLSLSVFTDVVTFPSLILASGPNDYLNFAFLRAVPLFLAYSRLEQRMLNQIFSSNRLLIKLFIKVFCLFYTLAATMQLLEIPGDLLSEDAKAQWADLGDWTFMNSAYFIIVTLSTVGYGDFSPQTIQGRIYALIIIVIGIIVFSSIISELFQQANRDRGSGYFIKNARTRHIIVTGNPKLNDLVLFITEFYSDPRQSNVSAKVVVLVAEPAWSDAEWFQCIARNQFLQSRLQYLRGSPRNINDLARAKINSADSVFILTSPSTGEDPSLQDTRTIMHILAVRNVRNDVAIYAQTLLEESNLQTHVALSTVSSDALVSERSGKIQDAKISKYPGLFDAVLSTEFRSLPVAYQGNGRRQMENILNHHRQRHDRVNIHRMGEPVDEALKLSEHVCLQEIQMALIAGNIKANGVGTLLSNIYLEVSIPKLTKEDPGWLYEYLMGANSTLMYTIIPDELNGASIRDIANDLFHVGVTIVAVSDPVHVRPIPILSTNETLRSGDLAMVLTYHERIYVSGAFHLVALRYSRGELKHSDRNSNIAATSDDRYADPESINMAIIPKTPNSSRSKLGQSDDTFMTPPTSRMWMSPSLSHIRVNVSADDLDALADADEMEGEGKQFLSSSTRNLDANSKPVPYIPENLKGHVIIATEGTVPLQNLPLLLRNLWHKDNRRAMKKKKRERIVVINPNISNELRKRFERFEGLSLFFVEGSPASRATWRKAKLNTANAVASVADITKPMFLSDARTIFTLLTLDVSTSNDHDLFICSELIDETALEYLREPSHARRLGARLGEPMERAMSMYIEPSTVGSVKDNGDSSSAAIRTPPASPSSGVAGPGGDATDVNMAISPADGDSKKMGRTIKFDSEVGGDAQMDNEPSIPKNLKAGFLNEEVTSSKETRENSVVGSTFARFASKAGLPRKTVNSTLQNPKAASIVSGEAKALAMNLGKSQLEGGTDPKDRAGAARARRSTLFSRSRYASGELLVQSSALSLLAREYTEPGFVSFFTNVLGTEPSHPGMKIRLVRIPKSLFDPARGYTCNQGRRLIPYNDVVHILIDLGVTPLGIYRCGSAPVLIPQKLRHKRGMHIVQALEPMLETSRISRSDFLVSKDDNMKMIGSTVKNLAKRMKDVNPVKQRELLGREEVAGNMQHLFSLDSSDDDDDDGKEVADDTGGNGQVRSPEQGQASEGGATPAPKRPVPSSLGTDYERKDELSPGGSTKMGQILTGSSDHPEVESEKVEEELASKTSVRRGFGKVKGSSNEDEKSGGLLGGWRQPNREDTMPNQRFVYNPDPALAVPGGAKYLERPQSDNLLPYVYSMPEPNTWCAENDGIYILCDPSFDLPSKWSETDIEEAAASRDAAPESMI